jgi:hypothetical protein
MSLHIVGASHDDLRGAPAPIGPAAPINWRVGQNQPKEQPATTSGAVIKVVQVHRRWIIGLSAPRDMVTPPCSTLQLPLAYNTLSCSHRPTRAII